MLSGSNDDYLFVFTFIFILGCIGSEMSVGPIVYEPPRNGPTLWEIGVPDRTAGEFYIPDPYPTLMNKLYVNPLQDRLVLSIIIIFSCIIDLRIILI